VKPLGAFLICIEKFPHMVEQFSRLFLTCCIAYSPAAKAALDRASGP